MEYEALHQLCSKISSGGTPSRKKPEYYTNNSKGHLWVKSKELLDRPIIDTEEKITDEGLNKSAAKYSPVNTVLMAMYGANVGKLGWLKRPATVNQAVCGMVVNENVANFRYVFYALLHTRKGLIAKAQGAAQQNLNQGLIRDFKIPKPDLPTQRKIASILSAYDDLIENNTRRIQILEEMARALYREWFVNFRFPGHERVKMVESELGTIPDGWVVRKLHDLVETQYGITKSATENEVGLKFVRGTDINKTTYIDWVTVPYCEVDETEFAKYGLNVGDVLVIRMADPGKVAIIEKEIGAVFGSYLIRLKVISKKFSEYYLFYFLLSDWYQDYIAGASTGTTRKSASAGVLTDIDIIVPPKHLRNEFDKQVSALRQLLNNLLESNANLRQTRDLLLPKLISGELDVSELDTATEELEP